MPNLKTPVYLHFEDGTKFNGIINLDKDDQKLAQGIWGESAFTTGMSGYQETITDPSFLGQHIIFTNSHTGNYPADERVLESDKTFATSVICRNFTDNEYLNNLEIPLISEIDTRALVKYLTTISKNHVSVITASSNTPNIEEFSIKKLKCNDLSIVSQTSSEVIIDGENPIVLINYGMKNSIINNLKKMKLPLVTLPYNISSKQVKELNPRLIFLSNGPGDPSLMSDQISVVKELLSLNIPMRGICLGHQLLGLALGAKTIKLPFGQRGANHPVFDHKDGKILITSQNHGFSIESTSFNDIASNNAINKNFYVEYTSLFDKSIEGISTDDNFIKSVQFHPEAGPGPKDAMVFFTEIENYLNKKSSNIDINNLKTPVDLQTFKRVSPYKKILIIGPGPIRIGQASEFDYSGTQACKALKEEGVEVVLLNSNPATIMTDEEMAHKTYIEPITKETIKKIILKEKVDAVLSTMGGQTALNESIDLEKENFLSENNVALLGANIDTINKTEDRELFGIELEKLGYKTGKRYQVYSKDEALTLAESTVGLPLIIRRNFALGGAGSALVKDLDELRDVFDTDIEFPITLEKSLLGHKELELEVMVDSVQNGVIICSIENIDPCGIHTGDSITVAPAQTISDRCYQQLRTMALTMAKHLGVVAGGANVQFAINPDDEDDIVVIEMNPRVSRSSALASKATGYPIAKISAKLAIGYLLPEILNDITKVSPVSFEPTMDYVAVKFPIFPFNKFPTSSRILGPQMRAVGEVLALGGNFNEAFMKGLRSLELGLEIPSLTQLKTCPIELEKEYVLERLQSSMELSLLTCLEAMRLDFSVEEIHKESKISRWFLDEVYKIFILEKELKQSSEKQIFQSKPFFLEYKKNGFSDKHLALLSNTSQKDILKYRIDNKITPSYRAVDTCSGEFDALTPYFYSTYTGDLTQSEAKSLSDGNRSIAIFGSGPNRIGQGIEFDYSCVKSCFHLRRKNIKAIMINSNPETVSTDYDSSDRLYLAPLYSEDLFDILSHENPEGVITSFSGQTGIKVREHLENTFIADFKQFKFFGPTLEILNLTEDRNAFGEIIKNTELSLTESKEVVGHKKLMDAMLEIGLPVIIRPSFVIGGESMYIFRTFNDIELLPEELKFQLKNSKTSFLVENYIEDALEYDVDLIRDSSGNCVFTVCEHIEQAGVHSGDSGMITPPVVLTSTSYKKMKDISINLAEKLNIIGPINFQFAVKGSSIYCIEANPRASRTVPFLSKAYKISLAELATDAMIGETIQNWDKEECDYFCVKQSTFPFDRFVKDDIILGPKMRSTGETMGIDPDKDMAMLKSYLGNYPNIQEKGKILISLTDNSKDIILPYLKQLHHLGHTFYATKGTAKYITKQGLPCVSLAKIGQDGSDILEAIKKEKFVMVFNTPSNVYSSKSDGELIRNTAITHGIPCFTRDENIKAVCESILGSSYGEIRPYALQEF